MATSRSELDSQIAVWRQKARENTMTEEDTRLAIIALRQGRVGASIASESSRRAKAKVEIPTAADMLRDLGL